MTELVILLSRAGNACAEYLLAPLAVLPGWLSATLVSLLTGIGMLLIFKHTSNQRALKRVRDSIKANVLSLSLFNDSMAVSLRSQGRVLWGAGRLLLLSIVPMLVMIVPVCLLLGQLALWYQARPLRIGEEAVMSVMLADDSAPIPEVRLEPSPAADATIGPVRVPAKRIVCWNLRAREAGYHQLTLDVAGSRVTKELAVGDRFMRVSQERPSRNWWEVLLHPREEPLARDSAIQAIEIDYPKRHAWTCGSDSWFVYWFAASMIAAFCARPLLRVQM
jgi:hypothetical protein